MKEVELIEKRGRREKHFLRSDGTILAKMYTNDIHYLKDGKYEEIDNTLIKKDGFYQNKANEYKTLFDKVSNGTLLKIEKNGNFIEIKLKNANSVIAKKINTKESKIGCISYQNICDKIDLKYQVLSNKIKETIIIKENNKNLNKISFYINTNLNLSLNNGLIEAKNEESVVFVIDKPYMLDSNNKVNYNIVYKLKKIQQQYELELVLDNNWLNSDDIVYPVSIDPTITSSVEDNSVYDTYIFPNDTNINRDSHHVLKAGVEKVNGKDVVNRALIKFDLPKIGTGSEIIYAGLQLISYPKISESNGTNEEKIVSIHRITSNWDEKNANWETMNDKYSKRVESIYYCERSYYDDNYRFIPVSSPYNDITGLVKKWYSGTPNYGILLKSANETYIDDDYPAFFSKSYPDNETYRPQLYIIYRNQNGIESYLDYRSQVFSNGSTYVNSFNGNLTCIWDVGRIISSRVPVNVKLVYNTNDIVLNKKTVYGKGYKLNLDQTIKEVKIDEDDYLEYVDEDGTIHYFYKEYIEDGTIIYVDEDGLNVTAKKNGDDYVLIDSKNNKMIFKNYNNTYYLVAIKNTLDKSFNMQRDFDNKIIKIVDDDNNEINFKYENNKIIIVCPDTTINLNYKDNQLISLETKDGITNFSYDTNGLISNIVDVTGIKTSYQYYDVQPYRVKKVARYSINNAPGRFFVLEYGYNTTSIIDNLGKVNTLIFNYNGNLISSNSLHSSENINDAYSTFGTYGSDYYHKNQLLSSTIPVKYVKNYLKNSSFEEESKLFDSNGIMRTELSNDFSKSGDRSLKAYCTGCNQKLEQIIGVPKGKYYTFSGYFKSKVKMLICLNYLDSTGVVVESCEVIEVSNDFERFDVSIYYDEKATSDLILKFVFLDEGIAYIDDVQLEEGEVVNNYNLIDNSDFSNGLSDWQLEASSLETGFPISIDSVFDIVKFNDNKNTALKVAMLPSNQSSFSKEFSIKGKTGDLFNISFWFKNEGIQGDEMFVGNDVTIYFVPADGSNIEQCVMPSEQFHPNENIWQFFSHQFVAEWDYKSIILYFHQGRNANNFYITNLMLYKDLSTNYYDYDNKGNIFSIKDNNGASNVFEYDSNNQLVNSTVSNGSNFVYEYDNNIPDRVLNAISSTGITYKLDYDSNGNPISIRTSKRNVEKLNNGLYKIRLKGTNKYLTANGCTDISFKSNTCSNQLWKLECEEIDGQEKYKIICSELPNYSLAYLRDFVFLTNANKNNLFEMEKNNNGSYNIVTKIYSDYDENFNDNSNNRNIPLYLKVVDDKIELSEYFLSDPSFEFYFEIPEEEFLESSATYDNDGKFITSVTDSNSSKTLYDNDSITGLNISATNANNETTYYEYNNQQKISLVKTCDRSIKYEYNDKNLISKIITSNKTYNFEYDDFLNQKSSYINGKILLSKNEYGENDGNLISTTYGNNQSIYYEYDIFDRLIALHKMNDNYYYKYDSNGNVAKLTSNNHNIKYAYDIKKRVTKYKCDDFEISYGYDFFDNIIDEKYKLGLTQHIINTTYNKDNQILTSMLDNNIFNYKYDSLGRILEKNINNNFRIKYEYFHIGKRTKDIIKSIQVGDDKYSYEYNDLKNITQVYLNDKLLREYYYDEYNQLIKENLYDLNKSIEYNYDSSGNILEKITKDTINGETLFINHYSYNNDFWEDQLINCDGKTITYDSIGNPLYIGDNIKMNWINGRELDSYIDTFSNLNIKYEYNSSGIRTKKIINDRQIDYYLNNNLIIFEKENNNIIYYLYDATGVIGMEYNGNIYYYVKNLQGDIVSILDSYYNKIVNYEYDSWGKILHIQDNNGEEIIDQKNIGIINPFRYRSYYYDKETDLYYLNSRYYDPNTGRFISADNYVSTDTGLLGHNMYIYANNNPIKFVDPQGHWLLTLIAVAGVVAYVYNVYKQNKEAYDDIKEVQKKKNSVNLSKKDAKRFEKTLKKDAATIKKDTLLMSPSQKLVYFYENVKNGSTYDLKLKPEWQIDIYYNGLILEPQDIGNYHFGYIGRAMGYDVNFLTTGAGIYQLFKSNYELLWCFTPSVCDDPRDTFYIRLGALAYDMEHMHMDNLLPALP